MLDTPKSTPRAKRSIADRFREKYRVDAASGCWLWSSSLRKGYGVWALGRNSDGTARRIIAHRASYVLHHGPIPPGMCVCHKCDVRSCVNPEHLFLGTVAENNTDMRAKGRHRTPRVIEGNQRAAVILAFRQQGAGNTNAKLNWEQVQSIRARCAVGASQRRIARELGLDPRTINRIVRGEAWIVPPPFRTQ